MTSGILPRCGTGVFPVDRIRRAFYGSAEWAGSSAVEHVTFNHVVAGSIPARLTNQISDLQKAVGRIFR